MPKRLSRKRRIKFYQNKIAQEYRQMYVELNATLRKQRQSKSSKAK